MAHRRLRRLLFSILFLTHPTCRLLASNFPTMDSSHISRWISRLLFPALLLIAAAFSQSQNTATPNPAVNQDSLVLQDFDKRVTDYLSLHNKAKSELPAAKSTTSSEKIVDHRREMGPKLQAARPDAKQGDIFTPEIGRIFRRLIGRSGRPAHTCEPAKRGTGKRSSVAGQREISRAHSAPVDSPDPADGVAEVASGT